MRFYLQPLNFLLFAFLFVLLNCVSVPPLVKEIREKRIQSAENLINKGVDVNLKASNGFTPLMTACEYGYFDLAKQILAKGADINAVTGSWQDGYGEEHNGDSALTMALHNNQMEIATWLVNNGADISVKIKNGKNFDSPLSLVIGSKGKAELEFYNLLISKNAKINDPDLPLISKLMWKRDTKLLKDFLEKGANPNCCQGSTYVPLHDILRFCNRTTWVKSLEKIGSDEDEKFALEAIKILLKYPLNFKIEAYNNGKLIGGESFLEKLEEFKSVPAKYKTCKPVIDEIEKSVNFK
jgi:ankyrin repeat protein